MRNPPNLLGEPDRAREYCRQALEACERVRFRPEIALTRLQMAELAISAQREALKADKLTAGSSRAEALDHLDFAIAEFQAMRMQPSLERALVLRQALGA